MMGIQFNLINLSIHISIRSHDFSFEPSGRMHIAQGVFKAMNVNKCTKVWTSHCSGFCPKWIFKIEDILKKKKHSY